MKDPQQQGGVLRVDRVYPHSREKLWRALTDAEILGRWLMPNDMRPVVGHCFTFETEPGPGFDGIVRCEVLEIDAPSLMRWSWRGGPLDTVVSFELEDVEGGTRLVVTHRGFRGAKAQLVKWILKIGNRSIYGKKLPEVLRSMDEAVTPLQKHLCMSPWQKVLIAATRLMPGRSRGSSVIDEQEAEKELDE